MTDILYNIPYIIDRRKSGRPMQVNGAFHSIEKSRVINIYIYTYVYVINRIMLLIKKITIL